MASGRMLLGVCAVLMAVAVVNAADQAQVASVVVGLARCADCTRKNMKAEAVFKGLQVAIKCKNTNNGEYETQAVSDLQSSGAFSVPLAADLHGADCHAQLRHSATNAPCPGQEPSMVAPMSGGTFVALPGKLTPTHTHHHKPSSAECASAFLCSPIKKHLMEHFHHKKAPVPVPVPVPEYHPTPEYHPPATPVYHSPTPVYGGGEPKPTPTPTPIYHPPAAEHN